MTLPNSSGGFLSSMWGKQGLATFFYNNGDVRVVPFKTLSLKCAFGGEDLLVCAIPRKIPKTTEGLPDDWFQGRMFLRMICLLLIKRPEIPTHSIPLVKRWGL